MATMVEKLAKVIRVISVAPVLAIIMFTLLFLLRPGFFANGLHYALAIVFIAALPLLAYPLQPLLPKFSSAGRKGQRELAIIFSLAGYIAGLLFALLFRAPAGELVVYLTYFISGLLIALSTAVLKFRASGHACGIAGPVTVLAWYISPWFIAAYLLLPGVHWASRKLKRHTVWELVAGGAISVGAFFRSLCLVGLF